MASTLSRSRPRPSIAVLGRGAGLLHYARRGINCACAIHAEVCARVSSQHRNTEHLGRPSGWLRSAAYPRLRSRSRPTRATQVVSVISGILHCCFRCVGFSNQREKAWCTATTRCTPMQKMDSALDEWAWAHDGTPETRYQCTVLRFYIFSADWQSLISSNGEHSRLAGYVYTYVPRPGTPALW